MLPSQTPCLRSRPYLVERQLTGAARNLRTRPEAGGRGYARKPTSIRCGRTLGSVCRHKRWRSATATRPRHSSVTDVLPAYGMRQPRCLSRWLLGGLAHSPWSVPADRATARAAVLAPRGHALIAAIAVRAPPHQAAASDTLNCRTALASSAACSRSDSAEAVVRCTSAAFDCVP